MGANLCALESAAECSNLIKHRKTRIQLEWLEIDQSETLARQAVQQNLRYFGPVVPVIGCRSHRSPGLVVSGSGPLESYQRLFVRAFIGSMGCGTGNGPIDRL